MQEIVSGADVTDSNGEEAVTMETEVEPEVPEEEGIEEETEEPTR